MYGTQDRCINIESRKKQWETLYSKYEKLGKQNSATCYFHEVNYKLFAKPLIKKRCKRKKAKIFKCKSKTCTTDTLKNVDASEIIDLNNTFTDNLKYLCADLNKEKYDENFNTDQTEEFGSTDSGIDVKSDYGTNKIESISEVTSTEIIDCDKSNYGANEIECVSEATSTEIIDCDVEIHNSRDHNLGNDFTNLNNSFDLIKCIEVDLKSELKMMLTKRNVAKLLESDDYSYWHKCIKKEMRKLTNHISRRDLQEYMKHCLTSIPESIDVNLIHDVIVNKMHSNLKELFIKREFAKNDKRRYLKYKERIFVEWERLSETISVECLHLYGSSVLHSINRIKERSHQFRDQTM